MRSTLIAIVLTVSTFIAAADPLWPPREAKVLPNPKDVTSEVTPEQNKSARESIKAWLAKERTNYRAGEFQFSTFAAASFDELNIESIERSDYGVGLGFNYFISRNIGVGFEAKHLLEHSDQFLNRMGYHAIYRLPFDVFAPYVLVGGGYRYQDHDLDGYAYGSVGLDVALSPRFGAFGEFRTQTSDFKDIDGHQFLAGFKLKL